MADPALKNNERPDPGGSAFIPKEKSKGMSQFEQVTVVKKANIYYEGKVTSRTVIFADGTKKTLGIMLPGEYEFGTDQKEIMEIQAGELTVQLPGSTEWIEINGTGEFTVPANAKFKLNVKTATDYCCSYIAE
ncbi:MAG: RmlC-like protein [Paenibacillus sp.]|nr:RmlC-like protein [Paenibacillus sp.]